MKRFLLGTVCIMICVCLCSCGVCEACEGSQIEKCNTCSEDGNIACTNKNCKDGEMLFCNICSTNNPDVAFDECSSCSGSGKTETSCDTCDGKGFITNPFTWEKFKCAKCSGSGKKYISCEKCYGVGYSCTGKNDSTCTGRCYYIDCSKCTNGKIACPDCLGEKEHPCGTCCVEEYESFKANSVEMFDASADIEKTETILSGMVEQFEQGPNMGLKNIEITSEILKQAKDAIAEAAEKSDEAKALLDEIEIAEKLVNTSWEMVSGDTEVLYSAPAEIKKIDVNLQYDKVEHHFAITLFIHSKSGGGSATLADIYYLVNTDEELMHNYYSGKTVTAKENGNLVIQETSGDKRVIEFAMIK